VKGTTAQQKGGVGSRKYQHSRATAHEGRAVISAENDQSHGSRRRDETLVFCSLDDTNSSTRGCGQESAGKEGTGIMKGRTQVDHPARIPLQEMASRGARGENQRIPVREGVRVK